MGIIIAFLISTVGATIVTGLIAFILTCKMSNREEDNKYDN